ncbi:substrate-binding domain-containing protein [Pelomonas sp. KK5]|uniref:substrate-binding domain-containing protein n=1 Tax=Pelomonas sp. KK5 TaxID=1855730 RepID=UPI0009F9824A|nr:substrate-binding domain-containing protein [Pelomonas sp. KK5]
MKHLLAYALMLAQGMALPAVAAPYQPQSTVDGEIRVWGSPDDAALLARWGEGFRQLQPKAHLKATLHGPDSAMAGLYTDVADLAFIGRELRLPVESMAFEWTKLRKPAVVDVANAGIAAQRVAANLAVFVHPDNPLAGLTLQQLDAVFGAEHKRGAAANARTWGDLGLSGLWAARQIRVLAPPVDSIPGLFFRRAVMLNSFKWNPALEEMASETQALAVLASDPAAIVVAPMAIATPAVKALPLAAKAGEPFVPLTRASAADHSYPLARTVHIAYDHKLTPPVREFLAYVLSDEGQAAVAAEGGYLPLLPEQALASLKGLAP